MQTDYCNSQISTCTFKSGYANTYVYIRICFIRNFKSLFAP